MAVPKHCGSLRKVQIRIWDTITGIYGAPSPKALAFDMGVEVTHRPLSSSLLWLIFRIL